MNYCCCSSIQTLATGISHADCSRKLSVQQALVNRKAVLADPDPSNCSRSVGVSNDSATADTCCCRAIGVASIGYNLDYTVYFITIDQVGYRAASIDYYTANSHHFSNHSSSSTITTAQVCLDQKYSVSTSIVTIACSATEQASVRNFIEVALAMHVVTVRFFVRLGLKSKKTFDTRVVDLRAC